MQRRLPAISILLAGLAAAAPAGAQGGSADALFTEGLKLFDAGRIHEACERFEASYKLDPALGTLQNLATCHEQDGRTAKAYAEFNDLVERAQRAGVGQKARETLGRQHAAALAKKLSKIEIRLAPGTTVDEIRVDDAPLDRQLWSAPVPLDPGPHTLVFRAAGKIDSSLPVNVSSTPGVVPVDVPRLKDVPPPAPPPQKGVPLRTVGLVVGGAGALSLVVSGILGGVTFAKRSAGDAHCTGQYCDPAGLSLQDTAHRTAAASTGLFVVGLAAAGAGAFLFVWGGRHTTTAVRVQPSVGGLRVDTVF